MTDVRADATSRTALAARLEDPDVAAALSTLLDHADLLAVLVSGLDQLVARSEVIGDSLVAGIHELRATDGGAGPGSTAGRVDLGSLATSGARLAGALPALVPTLASAADDGVLDRLLTSEVLTGEALDEVDLLARTLVAGRDRFATRPVEVGGALGLVRLLKDPDVNRAVSYLATIAQSIGRELAARPR